MCRVMYPCSTCLDNKNGCCTKFKKCTLYKIWLKAKCQRSTGEMLDDIKKREEEEAKKRKYREHIQWMLDNLVSAKW